MFLRAIDGPATCRRTYDETSHRSEGQVGQQTIGDGTGDTARGSRPLRT